MKDALLLSDSKDCWVWIGNSSGNYSCKNGYVLASKQVDSGPVDSAKWSKLTWIKWCPPKINAFIWKLLLDRIPTRVNLRKRKILHELVSPCCFLCNEDVDETSSHLFFNCSFSSKIWSALGNWLDTNITMMGDAKEHLEAFSNLCPKKSKELWLSLWHGTIWLIWLARNEKFFKGKVLNQGEVFEKIKSNVWSWLKAKDGIPSSYNFCDWEICPKGVLDVG